MSVVLEALEKAQKEGQNAIVSKKEQIKSPLPERKVEELGKTKEKFKKIPKLQFSRKFAILNILLLMAIVSIILFNLWLNKESLDTQIYKLDKIADNQLFLPEESPQSKISAIKDIILETPPSLKVTGIVWDENEPIALVNGKFLKEDEEIEGAKIVEIQPKDVVFKFRNKEFTISVE